MSEPVFFHVGLMKSGTSYLQSRMNANRALLLEQGINFPGPAWSRHTRAVADLIGGKFGRPGAWRDLCAEVSAHPGPSVVSMEYLASIGKPRMKQILGDVDREVHIIITARDLGRSMPAMWQESVKNRQTDSFADYVAMARHVRVDEGKFWKQQDLGRIATRYADVFGADQVTVITAPPPGAAPTVLWDRFSQAVGIRPADWAEAPRANQSMGVASTQMLLRLNEATTDLTLLEYRRRVKALAKTVLGPLRGQEQAIGFAVPGWLRRQSERIDKQVRSVGVRVIGDLVELEPLDVPGADPASVRPEQELAAAIEALAAMMRQVKRVRRPD